MSNLPPSSLSLSSPSDLPPSSSVSSQNSTSTNTSNSSSTSARMKQPNEKDTPSNTMKEIGPPPTQFADFVAKYI